MTENLVLLVTGTALVVAGCVVGGVVGLREPLVRRARPTGRAAVDMGPLTVGGAFTVDDEVLTYLYDAEGARVFIAWHAAGRRGARRQYQQLECWQRLGTTLMLVASPGHPTLLAGGGAVVVIPELVKSVTRP